MKYVHRHLVWLTVAFSGAVGCVGTEAGNPPFQPEDVGAPVGFDVSQGTGETDPRGLGRLEVAFPAQAVDPAVTRVIVTPLDSDLPAQELEEADGVLRTFFEVQGGIRFRLQTVTDRRLPPVDVEVGASQELVPILRSLPCVRFEGRSQAVGPGGPIAIRLRNDCASSVEVTAVRVRVPDSALEVLDAAPFDVGVGEVSRVEVAVSSEGLAGDNLLFIEFGRQGDTDVVPITLFAP